jgi:D-alanyl-D-alanine carboxypeptidase
MKYQALVLLMITLVSSYIFRDTNVFSQVNHDAIGQQATVIDSVQLESAPAAVKKNESLIADLQNAVTTSQEPPSSTSDSNLTPTVNSIDKPRPDASIIDRPIIVEATSTTNELCVPIQSKNFLVQTIDGASILYEKNSQNRWPLASISKLMTAVVALENINQSSVITITPEIINETNGNAALSTGSSYTANDLLKALLTISSNDAAFALADSFGRDAFVQKMNQKAKDLSMSQTTYYEPSGLSYLNQSTAHDLFLLVSYIRQQYPIIFDITRQKTNTIRDKNTGKRTTLTNINEFAGRKDFFGGKTGFIDQSEGNLVSLFNKDGKMVFIAVMGSPDRFGDTQKILSCIQ